MSKDVFKLEYPTHILELKQQKKYIHIRCILSTPFYSEIVLRSKNIEEERVGINNLFQAIFIDVNKIKLFKDEIDYFGFCAINDLEFENQNWFKVGFFNGELNEALIISKNSSIKLLERLFPKIDLKSKSYFPKIDLEPFKKSNKKKCSNQIQEILKQYNITKLFHFTDKANVPSIIKLKGLYSNEYLRNQNITILNSATSENSKSIDIWKGLGDYVHLGFEETHPMMYTSLKNSKLKNPVVFEISTEVICYGDTMFSDINAIDNNASIGGELSNFNSIQFNKFHNKTYYNLNDEAKKLYQAEVLVKKHIPIELILNNNQIIKKLNL